MLCSKSKQFKITREGFFLLCFFLFLDINAQHTVKLRVIDSFETPIKSCYISVFEHNKLLATAISNEKGEAIIETVYNNFLFIKVSHIGFKPFQKQFNIDNDTIITINLIEKIENLQEVIVTAKESKDNFTSISVIDKTAMTHIQPTSFTDLLSLLPGGQTHQPNLNQRNNIQLREVGGTSYTKNDYATSSLGTSFVVDNVPIDVDANMQKIIGPELHLSSSVGYTDQKRNSIRSGVDMRSISTDDIEKVEIIRGIPSVKHGNLTSGIVKIKRKTGYTKWNGRLKTDGFSKLFYLGKGFDILRRQLTFNFGLDYINSKPNPTNDFENFERLTSSMRFEKKFSKTPLTWGVNLDYTGTIDKEKSNLDKIFNKYESYSSSYKKLSISNQFDLNFNKKLFKSLHFVSSYSQSHDELKQTSWVQIKSSLALPLHTESGEFYGIFVDPAYVSHLTVDGKPINLYNSLHIKLSYNFKKFENNILLGGDYSYSKNNGKGQLFDLNHPPSPNINAERPRSFKNIPSLNKLAGFIEHQTSKRLKKVKLSLRAGIRASTLARLDNKYSLSNKVYISPRVNASIKLPPIIIFHNSLNVNISSGLGKHLKYPTQNMLYPQNQYCDFVQLNYYHNNKAYRQVHYKTYILPQNNYQLKPAKNYKKEVRIGIDYQQNNLSITYFNETMNSGFRTMNTYHLLNYKKYDTSKINPESITNAPLVKNLPFKTQNITVLSTKETNGSNIFKEGIEFQYISKRINTINTRFTINGAWFKSKYSNSLPVYKFAKKQTYNGLKHFNLGVYNKEDNYLKKQFTSNVIVDTYSPILKLKTSLTFNLSWFKSSKLAPISGTPMYYIDEKGIKHPYGKKEMNDPILKSLKKEYSTNAFNTKRTPFSGNIHLKITKGFNYFNISMYVNNLFNYEKDNYVNGVKIERMRLIPPYFGMEMNINF